MRPARNAFWKGWFLGMAALQLASIGTACVAQGQAPVLTFNQLFPPSSQQQMGLHKLTTGEKEALRSHVQTLLTRVLVETQGGDTYAGVGGGHWVMENVNSGTYMILEDGSLWKIDPIDKIDAMLWLPVSEITVLKSRRGSPGYNYLLVNTDDGEQAHAKYMGRN